MTVMPDQTPQWARQSQQAWPTGPRDPSLFDRLDAPWKARAAVGAGVAAAGFLAVLHGVAALISPVPSSFLERTFGLSTPTTITASGIALACLALGLHRWRSPVLAWVLLGWTAADLAGLARWFYGGSGMGRVMWLLLIPAAALAVRGALALRGNARSSIISPRSGG